VRRQPMIAASRSIAARGRAVGGGRLLALLDDRQPGRSGARALGIERAGFQRLALCSSGRGGGRGPAVSRRSALGTGWRCSSGWRRSYRRVAVVGGAQLGERALDGLPAGAASRFHVIERGGAQGIERPAALCSSERSGCW